MVWAGLFFGTIPLFLWYLAGIAITAFCRPECSKIGSFRYEVVGEQRGGPLSQFLSNVLLENLDKGLEKRCLCYTTWLDFKDGRAVYENKAVILNALRLLAVLFRKRDQDHEYCTFSSLQDIAHNCFRLFGRGWLLFF